MHFTQCIAFMPSEVFSEFSRKMLSVPITYNYSKQTKLLKFICEYVRYVFVYVLSLPDAWAVENANLGSLPIEGIKDTLRKVNHEITLTIRDLRQYNVSRQQYDVVDDYVSIQQCLEFLEEALESEKSEYNPLIDFVKEGNKRREEEDEMIKQCKSGEALRKAIDVNGKGNMRNLGEITRITRSMKYLKSEEKQK